jgi:hypothetical protein
VEGIYGRRLHDFVEATPEPWRELATLAYVIASETTFTAALNVAPTDQRVRRQIRELLRDHADDERRHQEYFADILRSLWLGTPPTEQKELAQLLIRALTLFLTPDLEILKGTIPTLDGRINADTVAQRVLDSIAMLNEQRLSAEPMLAVLRGVGAFEIPDVAAVFADSMLSFTALEHGGMVS